MSPCPLGSLRPLVSLLPAARVETHSLLFPAPGFPGKQLPGTKQGSGSRCKETSPFPLCALSYPTTSPRKAESEGASSRTGPSRARAAGGEDGAAARTMSAATTPSRTEARELVMFSRRAPSPSGLGSRCPSARPEALRAAPGWSGPSPHRHPPTLSRWSTPGGEAGSGSGPSSTPSSARGGGRGRKQS